MIIGGWWLIPKHRLLMGALVLLPSCRLDLSKPQFPHLQNRNDLDNRNYVAVMLVGLNENIYIKF